MTILIFAGGAGTRLWPLSRKNSPKQFAKFKDNKSTLQMAIERVDDFGLDNVYISTNERYIPLVHEQIPNLPEDHVLAEPDKRDLGAAVCLTLLRLKEKGVSGPIAIVWADHFMDHPEAFVSALKKGEEMIEEDPERFVFLGEKPRFANHNLGWIQLGEKIDDHVHAFRAWHYRPEMDTCQRMFESGEWMWNPGYFMTDIDFLDDLYQKHMPSMYAVLKEGFQDEDMLQKVYPTLEKISFDEAIIEKLSSDQAVVMPVNLGWSDPGTLYALKEAMEPDVTKNYAVGTVSLLDCQDCMVYNEEKGKLVSAIGLEGIVIVNTDDAMIVCPKKDVPKVKALLQQLADEHKEEYL